METGLYDWIHPEERDAFERDYQNFLVSRTLFGTVTRYAYTSVLAEIELT